jgi:hypothetical protein
LIEAAHREDVVMAADLDCTDDAPLLVDGAFRAAE